MFIYKKTKELKRKVLSKRKMDRSNKSSLKWKIKLLNESNIDASKEE